jgi:R3H domain/G-patch domain
VKSGNLVNHSLPVLHLAVRPSLLSLPLSIFRHAIAWRPFPSPDTLQNMGTGAARQRATRKKGREATPATSHAATWSSKTTASSFDPASRAQLLQGWQSVPKQDHFFTLNQEARNTHRSALNESNRLRDNGIKFVSGGNLSQDAQEVQEEEESSNEAIAVAKLSLAAEKITEILPAEQDDLRQQIHSRRGDKTHSPDRAGTDVANKNRAKQMELSAANRETSFTRGRSPSASSNSSSEVILFAGRGKPQKKTITSASPTPPSRTAMSLKPKHGYESSSYQPPPTNAPSRLKPDAQEFIPIEPNTSASSYPPTQDVGTPGTWTKRPHDSVNQIHQESSWSRQRKVHRSPMDKYDDEEEILKDYIENMKLNHELDDESSAEKHGVYHRDYKELVLNNAEAAPKAEAGVPEKVPDTGWSSDDLRDFDELDTSEDDIGEIGGVFSRRQRASGLQYLVTPAGQSTDFAKWILQEKLTSIKATELILIFEESHPDDGPAQSEEEQDDENQWNDSSSDDSEEEALNDLIRDQESEDNENERILRQTSQMSDAELARLLNKQAELGIGADDIVLFDGALEQSQDSIPFSTKLHTSNRTRSKQNRRSKGTFPSAEAFANVLDEDPYNGFDVMDFERPSLKQKKKGRKSTNALPFELEEDELAEQLAQSWTNDRAKKAVRKAEREELRQAGLLGPKSRNGRVDLQTKYKINGMDMDQVKAEIRLFLVDGDREALALAPMSSPQRAQVHMLAKALNLNSHSQGKGDTRFPILTKTDFSGSYNEDTIGQIDALLAQKRFRGPWGKKNKVAGGGLKSGGKPRRSAGGGGGIAAGATYMDGDVVGASAPELGSENRGRAMLEKMGWSSGMGIGKVGNKGSVEVIKHVVKNTKAGLG